MSLSFVSSAVLSSTDGVSHNEERSIESREVEQLRLKGEHRPLFDQLRSNREAEQEQYDEFAKATRAGMRPLDEEDCAHLGMVESQRREREAVVRNGVEREVALFRAARAEREFEHVDLMEATDHKEDVGTGGALDEASATSSSGTSAAVAAIRVPRIVGKRKRRTMKPPPTEKFSASSSSLKGKAPSPSSSLPSLHDTSRQIKLNVEQDDDVESEKKARTHLTGQTESTNPAQNDALVKERDDESDDDKNETANGVLRGLLGGYDSESD